MKADLADQQICDILFNKLSFTDKLIEAHLSKTQKGKSDRVSFVERDPESFRNFMDEQMRTESKYVAPYDLFYMEEAQKRGKPEEILAKINELDNELFVRPDAETKSRREQLMKELDDILVNYERGNEDKFNLSKTLDNKVEVTIDVGALNPVQNRNDMGLSPVEMEMAPDQYLKQQRCRAEADLIKARIAYKVHSDVALTDNE